MAYVVSGDALEGVTRSAKPIFTQTPGHKLNAHGHS